MHQRLETRAQDEHNKRAQRDALYDSAATSQKSVDKLCTAWNSAHPNERINMAETLDFSDLFSKTGSGPVRRKGRAVRHGEAASSEPRE